MLTISVRFPKKTILKLIKKLGNENFWDDNIWEFNGIFRVPRRNLGEFWKQYPPWLVSPTSWNTIFFY